jgi:hypothetical protein
MIVKGSARSGPAQLAAYLLRSDEHVELIELLDGGKDLHKAFMSWHAIGEMSRGENTLYHAQISPETKYPMTTERWKRGAQILAEDLGMAHHPRAVVVHQGHGRPHAHVVFQRADPETFKLWDDGFNYVKHERASLRMALEFKHEIVPGKHAKRDRKKQPEFPRQKYNKDEAQYEQRTGLSKDERVKQITALHAAADNGPALKAALEDAGYILAQGDRGYVVVDQKGGQSVLSRNVGLKKKEIEAFMAGVDLNKLPTIEQAKAVQAERRLSKTQVPAPEEMQAPKEARKARRDAGEKRRETVDPERKAKITALRVWSDGAQAFKQSLEQAGYVLARGETGYCLVSKQDEDVYNLARHAGQSKIKLDTFMAPIPLDSLPTVDEVIKAERKDLEPPEAATPYEAPLQPLPPPPQWIDPELAALEQAIAKRHVEEAAKLRELHEYELRGLEVQLDRETAAKRDNFKTIQDEQAEAFLQSRKEYRTGIWGIIDAINSRWNPIQAAEKTKARELERQNFYRRLAKERADYETLLQQSKQQEIENLIERQRFQLSDLETKTADERESYILAHQEEKRIRAEIEEERRQEEELERDENLREGPPPPKLGK